MSEPLPTPPPLPRLQPRPLWREVMDEHEDLEEGDQMGNQSIGGWLILFAVGRVLAPLFLAKSLLKVLAALVRPGVWSVLTTPGSEAYHPLWSTLLVYEISVNALLLVFSIVLVCLFFARWKAFPPMMIGYMIVMACFYWGDFFLCSQIPAVSAHNNTQLSSALAQTVTSIIWVPYFLTSVRVRRTFVN